MATDLTDTDQQNPWLSVFAELKATLGGLKDSVDKANRHSLRQFQREIIFKIQTVKGNVAASPLVITSPLWSPPEGYWWILWEAAVSGPPSATDGTMVALANVNVDLYVAGGYPTNAVPGVGDWRASSGTSASNPGLPVFIFPGNKEVVLQSGESVVVVCSGAGVANKDIYATLFVSQYAGLANLVSDQPQP